jgi:hypothetical protein
MQFYGGTVWLEILHYLGIAFWLGSVAMLDFRLIGLSPKVPLQAFHLSLGAFLGLGLTLTTGLIMFLPHSESYLGNPMFVTKLVLLAIAYGIGIMVHTRFVTESASWEEGMPPPKARFAGLVSLVLWFAVLAAGRQVTYFGFTQG